MRYLLLVSLFLLSILSLNCTYIQYKYTYTSNAPAIGAPRSVIPIYVDRTFGEQDKLAIDNAINQWNYALNQQMVLQVVSYQFDMEPSLIIKAQQDHAFMFLKVDNKAPGIPDDVPEDKCRRMPKCQLTLAWADKIGGTTVKVVRNRIGDDDLEYVMLHEIGHLLYLKHVKNPNMLMYDAYSKYSALCIDQDSVQKVANTYNLEYAYMNYCISKR